MGSTLEYNGSLQRLLAVPMYVETRFVWPDRSQAVANRAMHCPVCLGVEDFRFLEVGLN